MSDAEARAEHGYAQADELERLAAENAQLIEEFSRLEQRRRQIRAILDGLTDAQLDAIAGLVATLVQSELDRPSRYVCPSCGAVSHNPNDLKHRYCARCGHTAP